MSEKTKKMETEQDVIKKEAALSAKERQSKQDFLLLQKEYRNNFRQRMFNGAKLKLIEEEIKKVNNDKNYKTSITWEGIPYSLEMLDILHDEVATGFYYNLENELASRNKLINSFGLSEEETDKILNVLKNKDLFINPPKCDYIEEATDSKMYYMG